MMLANMLLVMKHMGMIEAARQADEDNRAFDESDHVAESNLDDTHSRDWGHEQDFQFDDEGEYGDDIPF